MPLTTVNIEGIGNIIFSQNSRSKRLKLSVDPVGEVRVSYPPHVSLHKVVDFVEENREWITKQKQKIEQKENSFPEFPLKTKAHTIHLVEGTNDKFFAKNVKFDVYIYYPSHVLPTDLRFANFVKKVIDEIYRWEAHRYLPARLAELAQQHGFSYNRVTIRNNKSNWGSCSSQNNISLNLQLMKLPEYLCNYVLLHELVHTVEKNHGPAFWRRLNDATEGKAQKLAEEMKKYSTMTF